MPGIASIHPPMHQYARRRQRISTCAGSSMSHMNRQQRALVAKETVDILAKGFYVAVDGGKVNIGSQVSTCNATSSVYHTKEHLDSLLSSEVSARVAKTTIEVTSETTLAACRRLLGTSGVKVAALNFADAKKVCGLMSSGCFAQEESLGLCSSLYSRQSLFIEEYYKPNRSDQLNGLYHHGLIYSPNCVVFRDDRSLSLLNEDKVFTTDIITCPAPNKRCYLRRKGQISKLDQTMQARAKMVLAAAASNNATDLVLGAWGCGVFGNDPHQVADFFKTLLEGEFKDVFSRVVFAIAGKATSARDLSNFNIFKEVLLA